MKTVTTGTGFQDPLGNLVLSGNLILTLSQAAEVTSGGGLIAPKVVVLPLSATTAKIASTQIYFSDELTPSGTTYHAELLDSGGNIIADFGQWSITGASADLSTMVPVTSATVSLPGVVLTAPAADQHITGTFNLTTPKLNNVIRVDGTKYTTIAAAYADVVAGGTLKIPPNYTETLATTLTFNKDNTSVIFEGSAVITQGANQIVISAGTNNFYIGGPSPWATDTAGSSLGVTFAGYTGAAEAFLVGSSAADSIKIKVENIHVKLTSAQAGAIGLRLNRVQDFEINKTSVFFGGVNAQIGYVLDGTNNFTGLGTLFEIEAQTAVGATNNIAVKEIGACTAVKFLGGHVTLTQAGTSIGLWCSGPGGLANEAILFDFAIDNCATCIKVDSTFGGCVWGFMRADSTVTSMANFGAGTSGNTLYVNGNKPYTDSGTNSVIYYPQCQTNSLLYTQTQSPTSFGWQDVQAGGNNGGFFMTHTGNTQIGSQGGGAGQNLIITNTGTLAPGVVNVADVGFTTLPYRSAYFGTVASQYNQIVPSATAARTLTLMDQTGNITMRVGSTSQKTESAADTNVLTFTPLAVAGSYRVRFTMAVSAQNTATLGWTATWKDANGSAQAPTNLALFTTGVAAPALTVTAATNGNYHGQLDIDTDNSATAIVVKLTFTGTSFTAKVSATVERLI